VNVLTARAAPLTHSMTNYTEIKKVGSFTVTTAVIATCPCIFSVGSIYCARDCVVPIGTGRRSGLRDTSMAKVQYDTIRLKLFKIGAQIRVTVRRVWLTLLESYPSAALFRQVMQRL
jgi:Transposase DDE domain group 1